MEPSLEDKIKKDISDKGEDREKGLPTYKIVYIILREMFLHPLKTSYINTITGEIKYKT